MIHASQNRTQPGSFAVRMRGPPYRTRMYLRSMRGPTSAP